jgi:hypothetical protein
MSASDYHWEIAPQTFGKFRLIWTDGWSVDKGY